MNAFEVFKNPELITIHSILSNFIRTKMNLNLLTGGSLVFFKKILG